LKAGKMNPELQIYLAKLTKGVLANNDQGWICLLCLQKFQKDNPESNEKPGALPKHPENQENEENRVVPKHPESQKSVENQISSKLYYFQFASKAICTCCYAGVNPANWVEDEARRVQKIFPMLRKAHDSEMKKGAKGYPIKDDTLLELLNEKCPPQSPKKSKENLSRTSTSSKAKDVESTTSKTKDIVLSPGLAGMLSEAMKEDEMEVFSQSTKATPRIITFSEDSLTAKKRGETNAFRTCSSAVSLSGIY
jgi:hypothetical protein